MISIWMNLIRGGVTWPAWLHACAVCSLRCHVRESCSCLQGLEEIIVKTKTDIYALLDRGSAKSSRSHSVFCITVSPFPGAGKRRTALVPSYAQLRLMHLGLRVCHFIVT